MRIEIRLLAMVLFAVFGTAACASDGSLGAPTSLPPLPPIVSAPNPAVVPTSLVMLPATTALPPTTPPPVVILDPPAATVAEAPPATEPVTTVQQPPTSPQPTTAPQPVPPPPDADASPIMTGCVRSNIDFAAVREAPGVGQTELGRIPPGTCDVQVYSHGTDGRIGWLQVGIGGLVGWSAQSNFVQSSLQPAP